MIKTFLQYTISLPFTVVFLALFVITIYIVFGFFAGLLYVCTGFDTGIIKYTMAVPNAFKNDFFELIQDLINGL